MRKLASLVIAIDPKKLGNPVLQKPWRKWSRNCMPLNRFPGRKSVSAERSANALQRKMPAEGIPVPAGIFHYLAEN